MISESSRLEDAAFGFRAAAPASICNDCQAMKAIIGWDPIGHEGGRIGRVHPRFTLARVGDRGYSLCNAAAAVACCRTTLTHYSIEDCRSPEIDLGCRYAGRPFAEMTE